MATEPRLEHLLDGPISIMRGSQQSSSLQLPPLQEAVHSHLTLRPLPLEPITIANQQAHAEAPKLSPGHGGPSTEARAAYAKHLRKKPGDRHGARREEPPSGELAFSSSKPVIGQSSQAAKTDAPDQESELALPCRKRQKLDGPCSPLKALAPLAQPTRRKNTEVQVPSLAALNGLKTQLSNASHFPPITTLGAEDEEDDALAPSQIVKLQLPDSLLDHPRPVPDKKRALKPRRKWTKQETEDLLQGVALYGVGNWKKILEDARFSFNARTSIDLKDRFRTCCPKEYRKLSNAAAVERLQVSVDTARASQEYASGLGSEPHASHSHQHLLSPPREDHHMLHPDVARSFPCKSRSHRLKPEDLEKLGITGPFPQSKRRERRAFTEVEDADLLKGFLEYGPLWSRIRDDSSLGLQSRRAIDLRDRFRNRYPERYAEAGFKARPKEPPKPATTQSGKIEMLSQLLDASSPISSDGRDSAPVAPPAAVAAVRPPHEAEVPLENLIEEDDPTVPSISALLDWHDNTLPPFVSHTNGNGESDMQSLLLDHIQPLLTYDPGRSSSSTTTLASFTTNPMQPVKPRHRADSLTLDKPVTTSPSTTISFVTDDVVKKPSTLNLPPPADLLLPLEFDAPVPFCSSSSTSSSCSNLTTTATIIGGLGLLSSSSSSSSTMTTTATTSSASASTSSNSVPAYTSGGSKPGLRPSMSNDFLFGGGGSAGSTSGGGGGGGERGGWSGGLGSLNGGGGSGGGGGSFSASSKSNGGTNSNGHVNNHLSLGIGSGGCILHPPPTAITTLIWEDMATHPIFDIDGGAGGGGK